MLSNVRRQSRLNLLGLGVLPHVHHDRRVLHHRAVHRKVRGVVLRHERFGRLAFEDRHVLGDRVFWLLVIRQRHQLVGVLDAQHLQHVAVQLRQVIYVWRHLRHLNDGLILHNALRHCGRIGIADGNDVDVVVVAALGFGPLIAIGLVGVVLVRVVPDDVAQQL